MGLNDAPPRGGDKFSDLEQEALFGDHQRGEGLKRHIYIMVCISLYIALLIYAFLIIVWAWHIAAPHCYRWLEEWEIHMLERIVFGSTVLITFATKYFKKYQVV